MVLLHPGSLGSSRSKFSLDVVTGRCRRKFSLLEPKSDAVVDHGLVCDVSVTGPQRGDRRRRYSGNQPLPISHRRPRMIF